MTLPKSAQDKRDEMALAYTYPNWPKKSDWDREERYATLMYYEIASIVQEAHEVGFSAGYTYAMNEGVVKELLGILENSHQCPFEEPCYVCDKISNYRAAIEEKK